MPRYNVKTGKYKTRQKQKQWHVCDNIMEPLSACAVVWKSHGILRNPLVELSVDANAHVCGILCTVCINQLIS